MNQEPPLPPGWEKGRAPDGRIYFINHNLKYQIFSARLLIKNISQSELTNFYVKGKHNGMIPEKLLHLMKYLVILNYTGLTLLL